FGMCRRSSTVCRWGPSGPTPCGPRFPPDPRSTALPRNTFSHLGVPEDLANVLSRRGIDAPFPIQAATLPDALAGRDVCGRAPTGSGKTLAFGLAIVERTQRARPKRPAALVLVPTRELAAQ